MYTHKEFAIELFTLKNFTADYLRKIQITRTKPNTDMIIYDEPYNAAMSKKFDSLRLAHFDIIHFGLRHFDFASYKRLKINITCDKSFDQTHPAGSSLTDIADIQFITAAEMLDELAKKKNYHSPVLPNGEEPQWRMDLGQLTLKKPLNTFNAENRRFTSYSYILYLNKAPQTTQLLTFTITYTDEDGKVLTTTTAPITIKGDN